MCKHIVLFSHSINQTYGGMEAHFRAFTQHFKGERSPWKLVYTITCKDDFDIYNWQQCRVFHTNDIKKLCKNIPFGVEDKNVFFFNDGYWIPFIKEIRSFFPDAYIMMRSGGNEFVNARIFGEEYSLKERQGKWANIVNTFVDSVIANSLYTVSRMRECGFHGDKIILIRGGINKKECDVNIEKKEFIKRKIRESNKIYQPYLFVVASRLVKFKGINLLIDAIAQSKYCNNIFLLIVGDGDEQENLEKQCINQLSPDQYRFIGVKSDIDTLKIISGADVFCNTSIEYEKASFGETYIHTETMGRSMMEAVGEKIPLLATNVGGTKELFLENSSIGELVDANKDAIIAGIRKIVNQKYYSISQSDLYDWNILFQNYEEIWDGHFGLIQRKETESIVDDRRWSLCCRENQFFRKYLKYATYEEAIREGFFAQLFRKVGLNTPHFNRTWYSTKRQMYVNEYTFVKLQKITEDMVFTPLIWSQLQNIFNIMCQPYTDSLLCNTDWRKIYVPELVDAIKYVEREKKVLFSEEIKYLKFLPCEVLVHGDFSLINIFLDEETSKLVVLDYQNSVLGCKDWDYCYLLATVDFSVIPKEIIMNLSLHQLQLIKIISIIKLGRGLRKKFEIEKRERQYNYWVKIYEKHFCI